MNFKQRLKASLIRRSLEKRRLANPFSLEAAEHFSLDPDADETQSNSYYFSCHDIAGNSLLFRYARRGQGKTELWFAYKDADGRAYINDKQLIVGEDAPAGVKCAAAGSEWTFFFDGSVKELSSGRVLRAKFDGTFTAAGKVFSFGHDLDARVLAGAIAKEKWSKAFFADLQKNDQVHYEQPGKVTGVLELDGKPTYCTYPAMRDHSFGRRDWNYMNRHFWLMALFEDGRSLNANMVSYPAIKSLQTGYFITKAGTVCVAEASILDAVVPGAVPDRFTYRARLLDGRTFDVVCEKETEFIFPFDGGAYTIYEGVGTFALDGAVGRGVLEFGWNGDNARYV